jgi:hypothetical protein
MFHGHPAASSPALVKIHGVPQQKARALFNELLFFRGFKGGIVEKTVSKQLTRFFEFRI